MTAESTFYQFILMPYPIAALSNGKDFPIQPDNKLIWQLRSRFGCAYYVCMHGLEQNAREEDCSTPLFVGKDIPDYVLDYMDRYAKTMQIGATWYRQYYKEK